MNLRIGAYLAALVVGSSALAFEPQSLPDFAVATHDTREAPASLSVPSGVYDGTIPTIEAEGQLHARAWRVPSATLSTLRLVQGLRTDLAAQGYEVILDCDTEVCGGFDFRFGLRVLPAPAMNVDLFDFRVITARKQAGLGQDYVVALVSRGRSNRYVQLLEIVTAPASEVGPDPTVSDRADTGGPVAEAPGILARLQSTGHVVLADLEFASGAGALSDRSYDTLEALAAYLKEDASRVIVLVGHTDAVGSLEANVALSRRRAEAVRNRLVNRYDVPRSQVQAQGAGYMAPVASNLTAEGREANRRVEAVLLSAE